VAAGQLNEVAFFDIYPNDDSAAFNAAWSNYPYFASGVVVVSGIEQGLFVLRPNLVDSSLHVGDLDGRGALRADRWVVRLFITVYDSSENPVANAEVSGDWSARVRGPNVCTTDAIGQCAISGGMRNSTLSVSFSIPGITDGTLTI